jgi:hypothetical protein
MTGTRWSWGGQQRYVNNREKAEQMAARRGELGVAHGPIKQLEAMPGLCLKPSWRFWLGSGYVKLSPGDTWLGALLELIGDQAARELSIAWARRGVQNMRWPAWHAAHPARGRWSDWGPPAP